MAEPENLRRAEQDVLDALATYFVGDSTMAEVLTKICESAIEAIPPAVFAGISMTVDAKVGTYVFTHPEVVGMDQTQYDTGEGPCVESFRTGEMVRIDSTLAPGPFPEFRATAARHGMHSVISFPLVAGPHVVGALNMYAADEHAFSEEAASAGQAFATQAAYLLLNHQAYWDARSLSENLSQAMSSRAEIEPAKGIIMATTGVTADEAFDEMRKQSQHENVELREIASEIVRRAQRRRH